MSVALVAVLVSSADQTAAAQLPERTGYVTDSAGALSSEDRADLDALLSEVHQETGAEIVVVTLAMLDGTIAEAARTLFTRWQVGARAHNGGVVVVVVPEHQTVHIAVGERLKYLLPPETVDEIVHSHFQPGLRGHEAATGVRRGTRALADAMRSSVGIEPVEAPRSFEIPAAELDAKQAAAAAAAAETETAPAAMAPPNTDEWAAATVLGLFVAIGSFFLGAGLASRRAVPILFGTVFGGFPFLVTFLMASVGPRYALAALAVAMILAGARKERGGAGIAQSFATDARRRR
jgi:uncharacterized membrane protein YgcG